MEIKTYSLITGASCGLGKELATECAKRGRNLLLTALPGENIAEMGIKLSRQYGVSVKTYENDLTLEKSVFELVSEITGKYPVDMLINNAGVGGTKSILTTTPDYIDRIILLNMRAVALLTLLLLPELKRHKKAYILNIASMASFGPMPYKTVYPASKAFVYSFTRGLSAELMGSGITVSVAHPGAMKTNDEVTRRIEKHHRLVQVTSVPVQKVAEICIRQLLKGDELIIPGVMNKLSWVLLKIVPVWLRLIIMRSALSNEIQEGKELIQPSEVLNF